MVVVPEYVSVLMAFTCILIKILSQIFTLKVMKFSLIVLYRNNNLSILTEKKIRRSWNIVNVALGFGIDSIEIQDQPTEIYKQVLEFVQNPKPTLINILCQRHRWHAGSGIDNEPKWNTYEELVKTVQNEFGHKFVNEMLLNINSTITTLWKSIAHECS